MGDDYTSSTINDRVSENFSRVGNDRIKCSRCNSSLSDKTLSTVETKAYTILLLFSTNFTQTTQNILLSTQWLNTTYEVSLSEL